MNRLNKTEWTFRLPEINDAHRAAGFFDWSVRHADAPEELMRIHRIDREWMIWILSQGSTTKQIYTVVAKSLRVEMAFALGIHGSSMVEVFLIANRLLSEKTFRTALSGTKEIGRAMMRENLPGKPRNLTDN